MATSAAAYFASLRPTEGRRGGECRAADGDLRRPLVASRDRIGLVGLVALVALLGGLSMASIAAAPRTQSANPSYLRRSHASNLQVLAHAAAFFDGTRSHRTSPRSSAPFRT